MYFFSNHYHGEFSLIFIVRAMERSFCVAFMLGILDSYFLFTSASISTEATAQVIDGKLVAKQIREEITAEVSRMKDAIGVVPGLAVILVGDRKDSATYVRNKKKACESVGIKSFEVNLPENATEQEVLKHISDFNDDPSVHGILVQLPLPKVCLLNFISFVK